MEDNAALLPQRGGRTREHRSVNLTNFNPFPTDESNEFPYNDGEGCITVFTSDFGGQPKPSHKIPKALWTNFTQEEKNLWLSFSVDTRKRILSCSANDIPSQQNEHQASSMSSAVHQHAQPRHQSRLRSYNPRPINRQNRFNQQRTVRLTDYYDMAGEPDNDVIQDTSVRLVDQYNAAGESDEVIADNNATDEIVPAPNNELQVRTAMFTTNNNPP